MKKAKKEPQDTLREEYAPSDFKQPLVRGKYAELMRESSNVVILSPEVAAAFPNEKAVNKALKSLIDVARATTQI